MLGLNLISKIFRFILCVSFVEYTLADNNDAIWIDSHSLDINRQNNVAIFEGEVILWFEDMILKTDNIKIKYKDDGQNKSIDTIIIPAKLSAYQYKTDQVIIADSALYEQNQSKLILKGNVILEYQNRILKTPKLIYYTKFKQSNNLIDK